jgi:hypothetical protein
VADDSKDPADYQYLIGQHHLDDEDGLVYETTRVVVRKGFIVAYRRLITSGEFKPREESTPIHIADIVRMTAALQSTPIDDSVSPAAITPRSNTPVVPPQGNISLDPDRRLVVPEEVPLPSSFVPGWNSQGRLATSTPADKRRRLSQGLELRTNLQSEFRTPPRGRRKRKAEVHIHGRLTTRNPAKYAEVKFKTLQRVSYKRKSFYMCHNLLSMLVVAFCIAHRVYLTLWNGLDWYMIIRSYLCEARRECFSVHLILC